MEPQEACRITRGMSTSEWIIFQLGIWRYEKSYLNDGGDKDF